MIGPLLVVFEAVAQTLTNDSLGVCRGCDTCSEKPVVTAEAHGDEPAIKLMPTPLLDHVPVEVRTQLRARMVERRYRGDSVLFNEADHGDSLVIVGSGRLELSRTTADGHQLTLYVAQPGDVVGELALVRDDHRRTSRARTLEPTTVHLLTRRDFEVLRDRFPAVDRFLVETLAARVARTNDLALELTMAPEARIWRRLSALADAYGDEPIRMSQDALAHAAGTVRQTVNRSLRAASRDGIVQLSRGAILVLDHARLRELAQRLR